MDLKKWKDWRLNALSPPQPEQENDEIEDEQLVESFYHLNTEAKLGLSIRQMRKYLSEIERQYKKNVESGRTDESIVECWARTYTSLTELDERLHNLMKSIYKGKK